MRAWVSYLLGKRCRAHPAPKTRSCVLAASCIFAALFLVFGGVIPSASASDEIPFLVRFDSNVRGLEIGTEVEVRGIAVGEVSKTTLVFDDDRNNFVVDVILSLEPLRFPSLGLGATTVEDVYDSADYLVRRGLRARLVSSGLRAQIFSQNIGKSLVIELAMMPDQPPATLGRDGPIPELPVGPSPSDEMVESLRETLRKLAKAPIDDSLRDLQAAAASLRAVAEGPALQEALDNVAASTRQLQTFIEQMDARMERLSDGASKTISTADSTLAEARDTLKFMQRTLGDRSPLMAKLNKMLHEMTGAAHSLRLMAEYLERHPDALLKGKKEIRR